MFRDSVVRIQSLSKLSFIVEVWFSLDGVNKIVSLCIRKVPEHSTQF